MLSSLAGWGSLKHQYKYRQFVACFARNKKMPKIDTLDALEEREEHEDDYLTNSK